MVEDPEKKKHICQFPERGKKKKGKKPSLKIGKIGLTRGGKSSRTCRATHINLEQKASKSSPMHKKNSPSKGAENSEQLD